MMVRGRILSALLTAYAISMVFAAQSFPSYDSEAGRKYDIALQRVAELKKNQKRQKYRSYWMDCVRSFEQVERRYPRSTRAGDACIERAGVYLDMYRVSRLPADRTEAVRIYTSCQKTYPKHDRAPEALFRMLAAHIDLNNDRISARKVFGAMQQQYPDSVWTARAFSKLGPAAPAGRPDTLVARPQELRLRAGDAEAAMQGEQGRVTGIRHWSSDAYTRIVIDLDKPLRKFESHELREPDRLVFDLLGMRLDEALHKESLDLNNGILRTVRSSQYAPATVRVVLDLASIKSYAAFPLHDPERLVIDVSGVEAKSGPAPGVTAVQEQQAQANAGVPEGAVPGAPVRPQDPASASGTQLSLSEQMALKIGTIAIDAGHGGHDPGAIGRGGLKEKDVTLDIAKRLERLVREKLDCNVVMTRDRDVFIPLEERPAVARMKHADIFVSVHVNANRKRQARGIETYIQGLNATDREAMATAARENATTTKKLSELDDELDRILKGLSMQSDDRDSVHLANVVQNSLVHSMKPVQGHVVNLGVKRAFFYVLINTEMPSILAEVGFISNPDEERMLKKASYRQKIAEALFEGIKKFVDARGPKVAGL